jgi:3-phenylpropionate/trans-cinnamate dioxygenase ferredoxin reductase subunit
VSGLVVVGGSYAGLQAASSARENGYDGPITLVSADGFPPYQRPPLSKGFLLDKIKESSLWLRADDYFRANAIDLKLNETAVALDRHERRVTLSSGTSLPYDNLVLATGARSRELAIPGIELGGVCYLRTLDEAYRLKKLLPTVSSVVVIGGGFIGLESASAAVSLGKDVTILEAAPKLLERAVSPLISESLLRLHRGKGARILLGQTAARIEGADGRVRAVVCNSGERIACDLVIVGIGALPNDQLAAASGLACGNGIVVDEYCRTSDPSIFAAGDCTDHPNAFAGQRLRLESVQNALDQGRCAGSTIAGKLLPYTSVPRFWSDQYETKLQMVGWSSGHESSVVRGSIEEGRFSVFLYKGQRLIAIESLNRGGDQMIGRRFLAANVSPSPDQAADLNFDLRTLESEASVASEV